MSASRVPRARRWLLGSLLLATALAGCGGDRGASADVAGFTYSVGAADDMNLPAAELQAYAPIDRIDIGPDWLLDRTAYAIPGVDPGQVLVIKLRLDRSGPNAPQSDFMLLLRGRDAIRLLCPYMSVSGAKASIDCDWRARRQGPRPSRSAISAASARWPS